MPDIFVALDTSSLYGYYSKLQRSNVLNNFVLEFIDQNRSGLLKQYPVLQKFRDGFQVNDNMIESMIKKGEKENIPRDHKSIQFTMSLMKKEIKANIAGNLYSVKDFYQIINQDDTSILKALELIKNQDIYNQTLVSN